MKKIAVVYRGKVIIIKYHRLSQDIVSHLRCESIHILNDYIVRQSMKPYDY